MYESQVAILPDTKDVRAVTPDLNERGYGIYWHVNPVSGSENAKATKSDIVRVCRAHVDIDPPKDGSPWDKNGVVARCIEMGATLIVDSGNGIQAMWELVPGATVEQVENINRALIQIFGADKGTWNADRLLRVPDTINWPNAAKRARGLIPVMATEVHRSDTVYTIESLQAAWPYVSPTRETGSGEIEPIDYEIIPLPDRASPALYQLVHHPSNPDRSADVSKAVTLMGREGFSDAEIMGVIMNPALPISAHCLDQSDPDRQARRKTFLARAHRFDPEKVFGDPVDMPAGVLAEPPVVTRAKAAGFTPRDGGIMHAEVQMEHFKGCVYVTSLDKIITPNGTMLTRSRFDSVYGGYSFILDNGNEKTTKSAWEAFTANQRYAAPTADERCFRPIEAPMSLIQSGNRVLVNCYVPIETPRAKGDVGPFLRWLEKCYPEKRDRDILLNYMASLLQNPGRKFQWWPVLQSAEGTGKGFLLTLMEHCVGKQYCHLPNTSKMTRNGINFNGWIENKLFIGLNEIYSATRRDFLEELKSTVTDMSIPVEGKGIEEATLDNFANGFLFTNHQDGVPVNIDNRRYCVLFMALQTAEDIARAGMTEAYFSDFWDWGFGRGRYSVCGFSIINEYLRTFPLVAELDPAQLAGRAPKSSTAHLAVKASLGRAEQEITEAIEQGQQGFAGGWVSSVMLDRLLEAKRLSVPRNKRQGMMKSLGYDYHPALPDGRVHNTIAPDGSKPRLYVKEGHLSLNLSKASDVARMYSEAQAKAMTNEAEIRLGA